MQPHAATCIRVITRVGSICLGTLVVVVRELEVTTATMHVHTIAHQVARHDLSGVRGRVGARARVRVGVRVRGRVGVRVRGRVGVRVRGRVRARVGVRVRVKGSALGL